MNNICTKVNASDLKRLVEEHLNKNLATNKRAKVTTMNPTCDQAEPGQPTMGLCAIFDVIDV
jgi:hypothetical protein